MPDLYKNKYRIPSARLQSWDYASQGMYFITICTAGMECYFGEIVDIPLADQRREHRVSTGDDYPDSFKMELSELGKVAETEWLKTLETRPDMNLELAEFVVMPNHFHGIIMVGENSYNGRNAISNISNAEANNPTNKFGPQSKNIASVIRGFKSRVTSYARANEITFGWQARFHDHIIRSEEDYHRIATYIINNPAQWRSDKFYKKRPS
jgi:putative transposase